MFEQKRSIQWEDFSQTAIVEYLTKHCPPRSGDISILQQDIKTPPADAPTSANDSCKSTTLLSVRIGQGEYEVEGVDSTPAGSLRDAICQIVRLRTRDHYLDAAAVYGGAALRVV